MKWLTPKIGQIISLEYGKSLPKEKRNSDGGFTVAGSNGPDGFHSEKLIDGPGIVIGRKGSAGKITWYEKDFWPIDTTFYVRPKTNIDLKWLYYFLTKLELERLAIITGVPGINRNAIYGLNIPFPPPSEQKRIVEILDQADALRKKRAEADQLAERIIPALFYKMFGDPGSMIKISIGELIDKKHIIIHKDGNFGSDYPRKSDFSEEGVLFLGANLIDDNGFIDYEKAPKLNYEKAKKLKFGWVINNDVLLAHNATVGRTAIIEDSNEEMLIGTSLTCFRTDAKLLNPYYLYGALNSTLFQNQLKHVMKQATRNQVPITAQRKLFLPIVDISLQKKYGLLVLNYRKIKRDMTQNSHFLDRMFQNLLHKAFSGELTARWRQAHMEELLREMEIQAQYLNSHNGE